MNRLTSSALIIAAMMLGIAPTAPTEAHWHQVLKSMKPSAQSANRQQQGQRLRNNMRGANVVCQTDWQAHHIIPVEFASHRAVKRCGLNINSADNGICMPSAKARNPGRMKSHQGYHRAYNSAVQEILNGIPKSAPAEQTCQKLAAVQRCLRNGLHKGTPLYGPKAEQAWRRCRR